MADNLPPINPSNEAQKAADRVEFYRRALSNAVGMNFFNFGIQPLEHLQIMPFIGVRKNIVLQMMKIKSTDLIEDDEEMREMMIPALRILLTENPNLPKLDVTGFMTFVPEQKKLHVMNVLISRILMSTPNLQDFLVLAEADDASYKFLYFPFDHPFSLSNLKKFHSLRVFQMELFTFKLKNLMNICASLPSLRYINVNFFYRNLPNAEDLKSSFSHLSVFLFHLAADDQSRFTRFCLENLQNLQIIERFASTFCSKEGCDILPRTRLMGADLRHLTLSSTNRWRDEYADRFPLVTHLAVNRWESCSIGDQNVLQMHNIKSLSLHFIDPGSLIVVLISCGDRLRALEVKAFDIWSFSTIFDNCPRLQKASFILLGPKSPENEPVSYSFVHLKQLKIDLNAFPHSNLWRAPRLEKITLFGPLMDLEGLDRITTALLRKEVLSNLDTIIIDLRWFFPDQVKEQDFRGIARFIKAAANSIWRLDVVKFSLNVHCDYLRLARSLLMRRENNNNEEIRGVGETFGVEVIRGGNDWLLDEELAHILERFIG
ncbi:Hypothetical predicted protein [Cloeon dipterum]|uniref:Uncharacterized protein n=1 Tax=Cloeon dipterum TaxID=197152 RepID=A0A8S1E0D6_9INSE|nr:Hypothetical predicted protein [Cloeon dipterum]